MKFLTNLLQAIFLPLLEKLGRYIRDVILDFMEKRSLKKEQEKKTQEIKDATSAEEIRRAHRNNNRI